MSTRKLPDDAFSLYVALGSGRSYDTIAKKFGASKRAVTKCAVREKWAERLAAIEEETRRLTDERLANELHDINMQHSKLLKAMASRVASALQTFHLESGMEAMRAAEIVIKLQRLVAGAPSENTALSVERTTRDEIARFLTNAPESEDDWDDDEDQQA